jgi:hypothetical protein
MGVGPLLRNISSVSTTLGSSLSPRQSTPISGQRIMTVRIVAEKLPSQSKRKTCINVNKLARTGFEWRAHIEAIQEGCDFVGLACDLLGGHFWRFSWWVIVREVGCGVPPMTVTAWLFVQDHRARRFVGASDTATVHHRYPIESTQ